MVFGRFRQDNQLAMQKAFLGNLLIQLDDLEQRANEKAISELKVSHALVWQESQTISDLPKKIALARWSTNDLEKALATSKVGLDGVWPALETVQEIIDQVERTLQDLVATLVLKQVMMTTGLLENNAKN